MALYRKWEFFQHEFEDLTWKNHVKQGKEAITHDNCNDNFSQINKTKSAPRFSRGLNGKVDQHQLISLIDLQLLVHKSGFDWIGKLSDLIHLLLCDAPSGFQQRKHTPDKLKMHEKRL